MGMISIVRPDWPPGSNAALLATQRRSATGYTLNAPVPRSVRLGGVLPSEGYVPPAEEAAEAPVLRVPTAKDRLLELLREYRDANIAVPAATILSERLGVTTSAIYDALRALQHEGVVRRGRKELEVDGRPVRRTAWGGRG